MTATPDVVIVGGGIFGAALAFEFGRRTVSAVLLEAGALGSGATGASFGWINAGTKWADASYLALNLAGMKAYETLASEYGAAALGLSGGGALEVFAPPFASVFEEKLQTLQASGCAAVSLSEGEMGALEPELAFKEGSAGLFTPADRLLDPVKFTRFLGTEAQKMRVSVREYAPVQELSLSSVSGRYRVKTEAQEYSTRVLILAAGTATPALFGFLSSALKRPWVRLKRSPGLLVTLSGEAYESPVGRVVYPGGGLHLRPLLQGRLLLASEASDAELEQDPAAEVAALAEGLVGAAAARFPACASALREARREITVGYRVLPEDEHPVAGAVPGFPGLFLAYTHSGITLAPYLAQVLASEVTNGVVALPREYRPERFCV